MARKAHQHFFCIFNFYNYLMANVMQTLISKRAIWCVKKSIDALLVVVYYRLNTEEGGDRKHI